MRGAQDMTGRPDGELVITGGGVRIAGWESVSVWRGVERIPASFDLRASAKQPTELRNVIPVNTPVTIAIGGQTVLTGYLERVNAGVDANQHTVAMQGRGRLCDLVDCAALIDNQVKASTKISGLARDLVAPFAGGQIRVLTPDGEGDQRVFPDFMVNTGESPYELIERVARYEGLLVYENADGNLVLSRVGRERHASGFFLGQNVQQAELTNAVDQRFSVYKPLFMAVNTFKRDSEADDSVFQAGEDVPDPGVGRYRPRVVISEQSDQSGPLAVRRAKWERMRRIGRQFSVSVTVDSWLDDAGQPWTPNKRAVAYLPALGLTTGVEWVITDVLFRRDPQNGTTAAVQLMPPDALEIEPSALNAFDARRLDAGGADGPLGEPNKPAKPPTAPNARGVDTNAAGVRVNLYPPPAAGGP